MLPQTPWQNPPGTVAGNGSSNTQGNAPTVQGVDLNYQGVPVVGPQGVYLQQQPPVNIAYGQPATQYYQPQPNIYVQPSPVQPSSKPTKYSHFPTHKKTKKCAKKSRAIIIAVVLGATIIVLGVAFAIYYGIFDGTCSNSMEKIREGDNYISIVISDCTPKKLREPFIRAAKTWSKIITISSLQGGILDRDLEVREGCEFLTTDYKLKSGTLIDHLIIVAEVVPIDGPNGILAAAAPCFIEQQSQLPVVGGMYFDEDDLIALSEEGTLETVVLHEMGHVLGLGTLWDELITDPIFDGNSYKPNNEPKYTGPSARQGYINLGGAGLVPVEDGRDAQGALFLDQNSARGSVDAHWKKSVFDNELMTFAIDPDDKYYPLSTVTIRALEDLNYFVDKSKAEPYSLPRSSSLRGKHIDPNKGHNLGNDIPKEFDRNRLKVLPTTINFTVSSDNAI